MSSLTTIEQLLERYDRGEYFSHLINSPAPHRLREAPTMAYHAILNPLEPRFTVVMPTFNQAPIIRDVLQALVAHASMPFDCIIVDDASDDETFDRVRTFLEAGPAPLLARATILRNRVPIFETACDNLGFVLAETEVIVELQADIEIREPAFDALLLRALSTQPAPSSLSGRCGHTFASLRRRQGWRRLLPRPNYAVVGLCDKAIEDPAVVESLRGRVYQCETVNRGPWLLRRSDLQRHGYLDERYFFLGNDDHDYHRRLWEAEARRPLYVPMALHAPLSRGATRRPRMGVNRDVFEDLKATKPGSPAFHSFLATRETALDPVAIALE